MRHAIDYTLGLLFVILTTCLAIAASGVIR